MKKPKKRPIDAAISDGVAAAATALKDLRKRVKQEAKETGVTRPSVDALVKVLGELGEIKKDETAAFLGVISNKHKILNTLGKERLDQLLIHMFGLPEQPKS